MSSNQNIATLTSSLPASITIPSLAGLDLSSKSDLRRVTYAVNGICMALILVFVSLRFYSRLSILNKLARDDGKIDSSYHFIAQANTRL